MDKVARIGIRVGELLDASNEEAFLPRLRHVVDQKNAIITKIYGHTPVSLDDLLQQCIEWGEQLRPFIQPTEVVLQQALSKGFNILIEGAQGALLDLDHGTYPFVTSSNPVAGGACTGSGIGPLDIDRVIGVAKAYTTRVGAGPFPGELADDVAEHLVEVGDEFGTNTGRRRRVGWLDTVMLRYAVRVNSLTELAVAKLDVLDALDTLKICVAYDDDGERHEWMPYHQSVLHRATPIYEELPGWESDLTGATHRDDLPARAEAYLAFVEEQVGVPVNMVGVGPGRQQVLRRHD